MGGGGTVIKPALERALQIARRKRPQMIIIASDGHIFDLVEETNHETIALLRKLVSLARRSIFITTDIIPEPIKKLGMEVIKISVEERK